MYQVRVLINSIKQYSWTDLMQPYLLYLYILDMLATATLETYPYRIPDGKLDNMVQKINIMLYEKI